MLYILDRVLHMFLGTAWEQFEVLQTMYSQLEALYTDVAKFYAFDVKKYSMEEFFQDIKAFKDGFTVSRIDTTCLLERLN